MLIFLIFSTSFLSAVVRLSISIISFFIPANSSLDICILFLVTARSLAISFKLLDMVESLELADHAMLGYLLEQGGPELGGHGIN